MSGRSTRCEVRHASAVAVGHVGIDGEDDVGAAQDIRAARIAEAEAALALCRIGRQLDELGAVDVVALYQLTGREVTSEKEDLTRFAAAADESLHPVADDIHACLHGQGVDETDRRQHNECARIPRCVQGDDGDVVRIESRQTRAAGDAPIRVRIKRALREIVSQAPSETE